MQKTAGKIILEARLRKGLTQVELANKTGIYANTIAKIERDVQKPKFSTLKKLAEALDLNLSDIPA